MYMYTMNTYACCPGHVEVNKNTKIMKMQTSYREICIFKAQRENSFKPVNRNNQQWC